MSIASLYPSINPSLLLDFANSKVLDPRITFTRTTTATYYDGVTTAKAEENLVLYSQEFNQSAWTKTLGSITANADTAPDGTATADLFTPSDPASRVQQSFNPIGAVQYVFTVYLRSATGASFSTDLIAWRDSPFNQVALTTITVTTTWQRFTLTFTALDTTTHSVNIGGGGSLSTGENIYLWGAQLEQRSSATAYVATTTQAITNYIPVLQTAAAGQARFDHNPTTGESLGLLIEEARTNLATYSEDFTAWSALSATASGNATIAPNGTLTADKIIPSSTGSTRGLYRTFTASGATTVSVYAKYGGYQWFYLVKPDGSNIGVSFDILNGVKGTEQSGVTGTITSVGNGWYRCTCTQTYTGTAYVQLGVASADNSVSVTVATNDVLSGTFIWGAQAETGGASFATSYIPNLSTGSTTRNADAASMTGTNFSSWFNNGEGTLYAEGVSQPSLTTISGGNAATIANIDMGTTENALPRLARNNGGTGRYACYVNGQYQAHFTDLGTWSNSTNGKLIGVYKANDFAASFNGGAVQTDNTGVLSVADRINIGRYGADGYWNSTIKKLAYYPIRVTNAQLQALTV